MTNEGIAKCRERLALFVDDIDKLLREFGVHFGSDRDFNAGFESEMEEESFLSIGTIGHGFGDGGNLAKMKHEHNSKKYKMPIREESGKLPKEKESENRIPSAAEEETSNTVARLYCSNST